MHRVAERGVDLIDRSGFVAMKNADLAAFNIDYPNDLDAQGQQVLDAPQR